MPTFDELYQQLEARDEMPPLYPAGAWSDSINQQLKDAGDSELFGDEELSASQKQNLRAGLLVWNDDIDAAHDIVQDVPDATGSFWHAIIHRREGDAGNSCYWWARTGQHPAFEILYQAAQSSLAKESDDAAGAFAQKLHSAGRWLPTDFVELCEKARRGKIEGEWLQRLQVVEFQTLLNWCRKNP
jgi:hypothetical protein